MIVDKLENIGRYASLGGAYETAVRFLTQTDLSALAPGRIEIDGERVFASVADNFLDRSELAWEAHQRYADIQIILKGSERFGWGSSAQYGPLEGDFQACTDVKGFGFSLDEGQFVLFFPGEPHAPGNPPAAPALCRKLIVKVLHGA